jgi:hypothetical protein
VEWAAAWAAWITKPKLNINYSSRASKEVRLFCIQAWRTQIFATGSFAVVATAATERRNYSTSRGNQLGIAGR